MFKRIDFITKVTSYATNKDKLLYCLEYKEIIDFHSKIILVKSDYNLSDILFDKLFYCNETNPGSGILIDKQIHYLEGKMIKGILQANDLICSYQGKTILLNYYSLEESILLDHKMFVYLIKDENIFYKKDSFLSSISIIKQDILWKADLTAILKEEVSNSVNQNIESDYIICSVRNILWTFLNTGDLIGLESDSGKLLYKTGEITSLNFTGKDQYLIADAGMRVFKIKYRYDDTDNKIKGMFFRGYAEMDLNSPNPQINFWAIEDQMVAYGLKEIHFEIAIGESDDIYFMDINSSKWGIFNTRTKTIAYVSEKITIPDRPDAFTQLKQIKYAGGKVFVLDSNRTLHIFEKEID
jgi:hypothetical protein